MAKPSRTWSASARRLLFLFVIVVALGGCYLPVRFDAEIEITRYGIYKMTFDGYMAEVTLFDGIQKGKVTAADEAKKVAIIEADFTRDSSTKVFEYIREGHFRVRWHKEGDLLRSGMVAFFRRNENILSLQYGKKTGRITMRGKHLKKSARQRLHDMGLDMRGELRVRTNAKVLNHNATKVKKSKDRKGVTIYIWKIKNIFDPAPKLEISL